MTVTETKQANGTWEVVLKKHTPRSVLDQLTYFGHLVIVPGRTNPVEYGDSLLADARYVGVYTAREGMKLSGCGMAFWLGDEDGKGDVFESAVTLTSQTFANSVTALLPPGGGVTAGTLYSVPGTYTGTHRFQTSRKAITYVTGVFGAEWRVNGDGTLDAGTVAQLYRTDPRAVLVRQGAGKDLTHVGLQGEMDLATDVEDYTTRVVLLGEGEGSAIALGSANAVGVTAKDIHGNTVKLTRLVSESETTATNANARAALALAEVSTPRSEVSLSSSAYDVKGDVHVGDYLYVYDPDEGFADVANQLNWNGEIITPKKLRCVEMTWPVRQDWTVAFRTVDGVWVDLTDYYHAEGGSTTIVVGDFGRDTSSLGSAPVGDRPNGDTSVPATPAFVTPFSTAAYQSLAANDIRASVLLEWVPPLNVDGSTILDGDHYEIRYRTTNTYNYPILWSQAAAFEWDDLQTWGRPLSNPAVASGEWQIHYVPWGQSEAMIIELVVAAEYEFQIRAVDNATPPNPSAWSGSQFVTTGSDLIPPSQPAAPEVAASRIAIQVTHRLGESAGGTFNLAPDLHHLEVHVGGGPGFWAHDLTRVGTLIANAGHLTGQIPVVGTFQVDYTDQIYVKVIAVDRFGNKSSSSEGVQATALLIDSAHISDLTASKITAGTISSSLILSGSIKTAESGQRAELNQQGLQLYDPNGELTVNLTADPASPNFISITDGTDNTVASMDQDGNISGQIISAADDLIIAGDSFLNDLYDPLPKGIVAYGKYDVADNGGSPSYGPAAGLGFGGTTPFMELSFVAEAGRRYRVRCNSQIVSTVVDDEMDFELRDGGENQPSTSSPLLNRSEVHGGNEIFAPDNTLEYTGEFTAGLHRLLWCFFSFDGSSSIYLNNHMATMYIEDVGSAALVTNTAIIHAVSGGTAPPPVTNYTKTYNASWFQTYKETGAKKDDTTANQGRYSSLDGNQRSLIGFPYSQIMSDLSGATITKVELTMYAEHWYYNSGGNAVIGTHDYTSEPSSWSGSRVDDDRLRSNSWPRAAKRTVSLGTTIGNDFKNGDAKGIALGPGPSTDLIYYGKFSGTGATASNRPVLKIYYTK